MSYELRAKNKLLSYSNGNMVQGELTNLLVLKKL